jgi:hypothetical protein
VSARVCVTGRIANTDASARYTYCSRQLRGRLVSSGSITYRTAGTGVPAFVHLGQLINGVRAAATQVMLPGTARTTTLALPTLSSALVVGDRTAATIDYSSARAHRSVVLRIR